MTMIRLARNEFLRFTSGRLPRLALCALLLVPLLFGAMYIYANWDPYGRLGNVPVALVNADKGAKGPDGKQLSAGDVVSAQLEKSHTLGWHRVDAKEASRGVTDGDYTFALTLPADFSAALVSPADSTPRRDLLTLTTNNANNYLVRTIAAKVVGEVRATVATRLGQQAAERLLTGLSTTHDQLTEAANRSRQLLDDSTKLQAGQDKLVQGANSAANRAGQFAAGLSALRQQTANLPSQAATLSSGARQVASGTERVSSIEDRVAAASNDVVSGLSGASGAVAQRLRQNGFSNQEISQVTSALADLRGPVERANAGVQDAADQLDALSSNARQVASGASQLSASAPALSGTIDKAANGANALETGLDKLRSGEQATKKGTDDLVSGVTKLNKGIREVPNPDATTRDAAANTVGDPLAVRTTGEATATTYGAGLAPFFLALAAWIGGLVLFLLFKPLSNRALAAGRSPVTVAIGGLLTPIAMGVAQMVVLYAVVTLLVGVHPEEPIGMLGFLIVSSITFVTLLHGLSALLGPVGKFVGLVLLFLQLISAGGMFPWQTIPVVLYPLHV
ncbi:MAG: YhgE/Pip family protein, partial [Sciscionella sp.]